MTSELKKVTAGRLYVSVACIRLGQPYSKVRAKLLSIVEQSALDEVAYSNGFKVISYTISENSGLYCVFFCFDQEGLLCSILIRTTQIAEIIRLLNQLKIDTVKLIDNCTIRNGLTYDLRVKSSYTDRADYSFEFNAKSPKLLHPFAKYKWRWILGVVLFVYIGFVVLFVATSSVVDEQSFIESVAYSTSDEESLSSGGNSASYFNKHAAERDQGACADDLQEIFDRLDAELNKSSNTRSNNKQSQSSGAQYKVTPLYAGKMPFKDHFGEGLWDNSSKSYLKVINESNTDAVVLLQDRNGRVIRHNVVKRKSSYTIRNLPECDCIMKVMYGNNWNSDKYNGASFPRGGFMEDVAFSESEWSNSFNFSREYEDDCIYYPQYSVTLHKVVNGNFHTHQIGSSGFFDK